MSNDRSTPLVFVMEQQPFDYTPAEVYGQLRFMEARKLGPYVANAPDTWNAMVVHAMHKELADYVSGLDYILPTGSPVRMVVLGLILSDKGPRHKFLGWDNHTKRYLEYVVQTGRNNGQSQG